MSADETAVEAMLARVADAAAAYQSRWTLRALRALDADLCAAVEEQRGLFHEACVCGELAEVQKHGEAMCRGWAAARAVAISAKIEEDAYIYGFCASTGMKVAISVEMGAASAVLRQDGVFVLSSDEVASLFSAMQFVSKVKSLWPGAEALAAADRYLDEPARNG